MNRLYGMMLMGIFMAGLSPMTSWGRDLDEALLAAALQGNMAEIRTLLQNGADVNTTGKLQSRPLHLASSSNRDRPEIVHLLIAAGADVNSQNSRGQTPLHLAVFYKRAATIKLLLDSGADPTIKDKDGNIPEDYTFRKGYKPIYQVLLKNKEIQPEKTLPPPPPIPPLPPIPQKKIEISHEGFFTNSVTMKFVYIKPGTFMMGSPASDSQKQKAEIQHQVTLTKGFYMQTTEVTQGQWKRVMEGKTPRFKNTGDNYPVVHVTWHECQKFIHKLNMLEKGRSYRLPTEAEWEYACRAGTQTSDPWNAAKDRLCDYANVADLTADKTMFGTDVHQCRDGFVYTAPVGTFKANEFGLFDMIGNVWEWCQDYAGPYPSEPVVDPAGPATGQTRVIRGCGWSGTYKECRSAYRGEGRPGKTGWGLGFRVAITDRGS